MEEAKETREEPAVRGAVEEQAPPPAELTPEQAEQARGGAVQKKWLPAN